MPLGELFSCVWLVLLAFNLMNTFPYCIHCSSTSSKTTHSSSKPISLTSFLQSDSETAAEADDHNSAATASISPHFCHHSIDTTDLISTDCQTQLHQTEREPRMRITGDINEGPGPPACPRSPSHNKEQNEKNASCYHYLMQQDCDEPWLTDWSEIRLRHCAEHSVQQVVPDAPDSLNDPNQCRRHINELLELDLFVAKIICQFEQVLLRYDCLQPYAVHSCNDCRVSYRRWVCAALIPHWRRRHKIKPCRSICYAVEQTCPWFLPADKAPGYPAQYAGEPIFQCIDPSIPETGEQLRKSTYGTDCCYEYCEEQRNIEPSPTSYHQNIDKSKFPYTRIVSCEKGCNESLTNPSTNGKSSGSSLCHSSSANTKPLNGKIKDGSQKGVGSPFEKVRLSSCSTESFETANKVVYSAVDMKMEYNFILLWFALYLLVFLNIILIGVDLR